MTPQEKREVAALLFSHSEWAGSSRWRPAPLRIFNLAQLASPSWPSVADTPALHVRLQVFLPTTTEEEITLIAPLIEECWSVYGGVGSRGMLAVVLWPGKHVSLTGSVSVNRFVQKLSVLLMNTLNHPSHWRPFEITIRRSDRHVTRCFLIKCTPFKHMFDLIGRFTFDFMHFLRFSLSHSLTLFISSYPV